jgi:hypothetical protein
MNQQRLTNKMIAAGVFGIFGGIAVAGPNDEFLGGLPFYLKALVQGLAGGLTGAMTKSCG